MKSPSKSSYFIKISLFLVLLFAADLLMAASTDQSAQVQNSQQVSPRRGGRFQRRVEGLYKNQITPNWFAENTRFWYRNDLSGDTKEFILIDAEKGTRRKAFDHAKLAEALSKAANGEYSAEKLPFNTIQFSANGDSILFSTDGKAWEYNLSTYELSPSDAALSTSEENEQSQQGRRFQRGQRGQRGQRRGPGQFGSGRQSPESSDGKWTAFIKDNNVYIRSNDTNQEIQLSTDGEEGMAYGRLSWAPDSNTLVGFRIEPGDHKEVYLIRSSPPEGGRAVMSSRPYELPGDKFDSYELNIFNVTDRKQIKPDLERIDFGSPRIRWNQDGYHFTYEKVDRGHQRFRIIEVNTKDGSWRNIIDQKSDTFIWTMHTENLSLNRVNWLEKTDEIIYVSEMDGWRHIYLVDAKQGKISNQITKGQWVVRGIDLIDEDARQIWFNASGKNADQDPYLIHYYRINFDGTDLVELTKGNGNHTIQYSPDRKYIIDTYSRVDMAPVHELRRTSDGKLVCELEKADISELIADGWEAPEVFVAKGRDGKTDIWGIISRPKDFDPGKKYPIIEDIYAGPQSSFTPKTFSARNRYQALNDLGFIVVKLDGMGTANRSKAFHDVCWKNLKDAGFPDRILWIKAAAKKYPYMDIERVGAYGTSAGGQNAAGSVLFHPEFYKVAVANCGCHDNRMDKASWNEQWMGYPVGPQYSECSNIDNAYRLQGSLFLIVGEMDTNVPPESTMRFVDALIKAEKDFDLLVVPNGGHGAGGQYGQRRLQDFFVRHLMGKETPNRNAQTQEPGNS
ncbi:MAG: prolyl oligopeptidase family serine peptidase [Sedimentisphaerales bacterium]|nr:prolyl oligopeptidase family serine peptidase [Sedimentisphaerales bacterium]